MVGEDADRLIDDDEAEELIDETEDEEAEVVEDVITLDAVSAATAGGCAV